jgi:hypothetical protein
MGGNEGGPSTSTGPVRAFMPIPQACLHLMLCEKVRQDYRFPWSVLGKPAHEIASETYENISSGG